MARLSCFVCMCVFVHVCVCVCACVCVLYDSCPGVCFLVVYVCV